MGDFDWQLTSIAIERELGFYFDKDILVKWADKHNLPLEKTRTCIEGTPIHCGACDACYDRKRSFEEACVADKTDYIDGRTSLELLKEKKHLNKSITFITGNKYKAESMKKALAEFDIEVEICKLETPEIQANTSAEVAAFSASWAANKLNRPVLKVDSGLFINCLNGLPGAYTSQFQKQLGAEKVLSLLESEKDRSAYIRYALANCEPGNEPIIFESGSKGIIAEKKRGSQGMLIDYIFIPEGELSTMGELKVTSPQKREVAWGDAENQFAQWFLKK